MGIEVKAGLRQSHEFLLKNLGLFILEDCDVIFQAVFCDGLGIGPKSDLCEKVLLLVTAISPIFSIYALHLTTLIKL